MRNNRYSNYKIVGFPEKLASLREGRVTAPIYVRIKPTNHCSHSCGFCAYGSGNNRTQANFTGMHDTINHRDVIPLPKLIEILDDLRDMGVKALTYSGGGEPLAHPDIDWLILQTLSHEIDFSVITNGSALMGDRANMLGNAKWIRVSIDYTTAEQMAASRNVPERFFDNVLDNIENFAEVKKYTCELGVNFIVHRHNHAGLYEFAKRLKDIGVENMRVSPMWVPNIREYHAPLRHAVMDQLAEMQKLVDDNFSVNQTYDLDSQTHSPTRSYAKCPTMQIVPVIGADLNVYGCHNVAYTEHGRVGSIKEQRFKEFWYSDEAKRVFDAFDASHVCRHQCAADIKNVFINDVIAGGQDNFV